MRKQIWLKEDVLASLRRIKEEFGLTYDEAVMFLLGVPLFELKRKRRRKR